MKNLLKRIKKFINQSPEHKTQLIVFMGFVIIPAIGMLSLYLFVSLFWLK